MRLKRFFYAGKNTVSQKGFTVIELIVYIGILAILLTVLSNIFVSSLELQSESEATSTVDQDARYINSRLGYDIHRASSLTTPATLGATSSTIVMTVGGVTYTYSVNGSGDLRLNNSSTTDMINSYDSTVTNFQVTRIGNVGGREDTLLISYTLTSRAQQKSGPTVKNVQTTIALRRQ